MMNQEHRPKGRGMSNRPPSSRGSRSHHAHTAQALLHDKYQTNDRFTHFICTLLGKRVNLEVRNGKLYNGVLTTVSPNFEFVLSKVHVVPEVESNSKMPPDVNMIPRDGDLYEKIIFKTKDIVTITCPAVELDECSKGETFQTDQAISHCVNGEMRERELQKWLPDELPQETPVLGTRSEKSNGWCAREMFKINEQRYGVTSNYDSEMSSYTTKLEKKDTEEYLEREKRAERIAREIELNQNFDESVDSGKSEEELYSAVVRQQKQEFMSHHPRGRQVPVIERKDRNVDSSKTPSPHTNSPVSSRKLNGEDMRQKTVDSDQAPKPEIKIRSPKDMRDGKREFNPQQLKEKILNSKPMHVKLEERSQKANKSVDPKELYDFSRGFNLNTKQEEQKIIKKQMPETQDIRKIEENEKLRAEEVSAPVSPTPMPVSSTPPAPEISVPAVNEDNKPPTQPASKPSAPEPTQSSPALKSSLNPNAKEFKPTFKPANSKPSSPSQSQGIATPVQPTVQQPPGAVVPRMSYQPHIRQQRPRGGYPPRSEYHEQQQYSSSSGSPIMTAAVAAGQPIMAQPLVYPPQYTNPVPFPNMPIQGPMVVYRQGGFIPQVGYNMPISAQAPVMASGQGTMVTAGSYQTGSGSFQDGTPMQVYGNMSAGPQHPIPGQPQYPQHHVIATTPTGPPQPHQSPQPHPQPIFFQQQPSGLQPPPNQPQTIMQPGPAVGMPQAPAPMLVMQQTPQNLPQSAQYNR